MRHLTAILALILVTAYSSLAQTTPSPGATTPTPGSLRILNPKNGDKVAQDFVDLTFEVAAPASAQSSPTFQVRLDSADPVRTTDLRYTFTGLKPGRHTVSVQMLDANDTPVQGSRAEVHFTVPASAPQSAPPIERRPSTAKLIIASASSAQSHAHLQQAAFQESSEPGAEQPKSGQLPQSGGELPLLALIGASGLIGGILCVGRTRRQ